MNVRLTTIVVVLSAWLTCGLLANAQSFNIDLDVFSGTPEQGNGAPSSSFGAAAGQMGTWNRAGFGPGLQPLLDTDGIASGVTLEAFSSLGFFSGVGFRNETNTGDYALLLNDAAAVNTIVQGGALRYEIRGLQSGLYQLFTYAVAPQGYGTNTAVTVPQSSNPITQTVTGPMPGNSFGYLVTHSIHEVVVGSGGLIEVLSEREPNNFISYINGFQLVAVPEPNSLIVISALLVFSATRGFGRYNVAGGMK